jgi:predicted aspartyl protease
MSEYKNEDMVKLAINEAQQVYDLAIICCPELKIKVYNIQFNSAYGDNNMSKFMVNLTAVNPKEEHRCTPPIEVMVDTGSELSWLPKQPLLDAGITPKGKKRFVTATKEIVERDFGYAILQAEGYATNDEIVFAEESDMSLLGVRTIEGFSVMVDNIGHRFVATVTIVA